MMDRAALARSLQDAVLAQHFERTPDALRGGAPVAQFPSLDLAVVAFPRDAAPVWANVLFSREHPQGVVAEIGADAGPVRNIRFDADQRDEALNSIVWQPEADWSRIAFQPLWGEGPHRFVAPYPASLIKLMVAVGIARLVDQGRCDWSQPVTFGARTHAVADWCEDMIMFSCNDSTTAMVALLHACGALAPRNELEAAFAARGLPTLRLADTRADAGWSNAAGAGVGHLQMTAWDSARLLWLLDRDAPVAPWLEPRADALVSDASRARLRAWLEDQALHEILSSTALAGVPGYVAGLPAQLPARWIDANGGLFAGSEHAFPADVRPASLRAEVRFAHKTGTTENYASDAGIVTGIAPHRRGHYIVALLTNLGTRYAPGEPCATTWRIPALGRAIDEALSPWLR
jgi:beta-lactamase class A